MNSVRILAALLALLPFAADAAFPTVVSESTDSEDSNVTSHVITLPSGIEEDDLVLCAGGIDQTNTVTYPSPWVEFDEVNDGNAEFSAGWLRAEGSETTLTITTADEQRSVFHCWRITGDDHTQPPELVTDTYGDTDAPDPSAITPTGGSKDYLWITAVVTDSNPTALTVVSFPSGYGNTGWDHGDASTGGVMLGWGRRNNTAASENPGAWELSGEEAGVITGTFAIHPAEEEEGDTDCTGYPTGGVQCIELTSVHATSPLFGQGVAAGDFLFTAEETTPSDYPVTAEADATISYAAGGDTSRQIIPGSVYDITAVDTLLFTFVFNNLTCGLDESLFDDGPVLLQKDVAISTQDILGECVDPEGDAVSVSVDVLPTGLSLTAGEVDGTPTVCQEVESDYTFIDDYGAEYTESKTYQIGDLVPATATFTEAATIAAIEAECGFEAVEGDGEYSGTIDEGDTIRTDPPDGWLSPFGEQITYILSLGECIIPDVVGMTMAAAIAAIEAACP